MPQLRDSLKESLEAPMMFIGGGARLDLTQT
jgi:hypothetical protein